MISVEHARASTIALVRALRRARMHRPRRRIPRPIPPRAIELAYYQALRRILDTARRYVVAELSAELGIRLDVELGAPPGPRVNRAIERAAERFYEQALRPRDVEALAELLADRTSVYQRGQHERQIRAGLGVDVFLQEPRLTDVMAGFTSENVALIKSIPEQYFGDIEKTITREINAGTRHEDLAAILRDRYGVAESRAALIARDQTGKMVGALAQARQSAMGITSYTWQAVLDNRTRPDHVERDGKVFKWSDPPEDGHPGQAINCRCFASPLLDDILGDL